MRRSARTALATTLLGLTVAGAVTPARAASTTLTGTIEVVATIALSSNVPANTPISAQATFFYDVAGASQNGSVSASVKHSGKTATVTLHMPYIFTAPQKPTLVGVSITITAATALAPYASISVEIPTPANGATTVVKLPVSI